jgi:hypothetical protein
VLKLDNNSIICRDIASRLLNDMTSTLFIDLTEWTLGNRPRDLSQVASLSDLIIDLLQKDELLKNTKEHTEGLDPNLFKSVLFSA